MQTYTREEVLDITKPNPSWMNFNVPVVYTKRIIPLKEVLETLHTVWDDIEDFERPTFLEYVQVFQSKDIFDLPIEKHEKIKNLLESKYIDSEITISCFLTSDLKILLPQEYPATMKVPVDSSYVVEDGNHRLVALAQRILEGEDLGNIPVTVFYGSIK